MPLPQGGVGIFLAPNRTGQFIVTRVTPGAPAHRSGQVNMGDILLAVNGQSLENIPVETVRGMIVGPQGSQCNLTLQRGGSMLMANLIREGARDQSPSLGPGRRPPASAQPYNPHGSAAPYGNQQGYPQQGQGGPGGPGGPGSQPAYGQPAFQGQGSAQPYGNQWPTSRQRSMSPMVRGPLYGSAGRPMGRQAGPPSHNYGRPTMYGTGPRQPTPQQQFNPRGVLMTPERQRPRPTANGYTPSPAVDRGRQMQQVFDQYGRPIARPSMSPAPYTVNRGAPASPVKGGLGMTLRNDVKGDLRITDVAPGGPAAASKALQRGDIVTSISGRNVRGMSVLQAKDLIMGPEGSSVVLGVHREARGAQAGSAPGEFFEVNLTRASHVPASRENSRSRYSQSPAMHNRMPQRPSASPMVQHGRQQQAFMSPSLSDQLPSVLRQHPIPITLQPFTPQQAAQPTPEFSTVARPQAPVRLEQTRPQINEAMCGIGVFIEASHNGLLTIKQVTADGPASHMSEVQTGDFLVAIDGLTTLGMPMHQVRNMIVGRRGTSVCLSLRRLIHDPRSGDTLSPVFDVNIVREPPRNMMKPASVPGPENGPDGFSASPMRQPGTVPIQPQMHHNMSPPPQQQMPPQHTDIPIAVQQTQAPESIPRASVMLQPQEAAPPVTLPEGFDGICGVGINVIEFDGAIIIQKVFAGGPAARSGLVMKGDLVHRLDYRTVSDMSVDEVRPLLQGPRLSSVVLGLIKPKYRLRVNVRLQREYVAEEAEKLRSSNGSTRKVLGPPGPQPVIAEQSGPIMNLMPPSSYGMDTNNLPAVGDNSHLKDNAFPGHSMPEQKTFTGSEIRGDASTIDQHRSSLKELTNIASAGPDVVL